MLVLSRKIGEIVVIGGGIEVMVTAVHGNRVTLGIAAPKSVSIRRSELQVSPVARSERFAERAEMCEADALVTASSMDGAFN